MAGYSQVGVADQRPRLPFTKLCMRYVGGFFGLTAVVVYGNFWFFLALYMAGADSCARDEQEATLIINACVFLVMGTIAFLLEYTACHRSP
jgi:succinate-acetate transporter protein